MPPKQKQTRLPRRGAARAGEMNLEAAAEERIDAITAEPLDPQRFVEVLSPDKTLRLFYNISTLVRIANDKGGFMQPPHFREPMHASLVAHIEKVEGKHYRFEKQDKFIPSYSGDADDAEVLSVRDGEGLLVQHRHVYFDQIIDEFYHLNSAEVYVCPVCYDHYVKTRYIPYLVESGARVPYLDDGETFVIDPLDVLSYMMGGAVDSVDEEMPISDDNWDTPLAHIVFRRAAAWRKHMTTHHVVFSMPASDFRLRDVLCTYHNRVNLRREQIYQRNVKAHGAARKKMALTQQRYWMLNARYNCLRYNKVVEATEAAEGHPEAVSQTAFGDEDIADGLSMLPPQGEESDFVVDDDDCESSEGGHEGPHYSPPFDDLSSAGTSSSSSTSSASEQHGRKRRRGSSARKRGRKVEAERTNSSGTDEETNSPAHGRPSVDVSSSETVDGSDATESVEESPVSRVNRQSTLFKQGILKATDSNYQRLSAEDRHFVAFAERQRYQPSQLYDPIAHRRAEPQESSQYDDIDWGAIGGDLTPATRAPPKGRGAARTPPLAADANATAAVVHRQSMPAQLLLSDDETSSGSASSCLPPSTEKAVESELGPASAPVCATQQRLLVDDED